MRKLVVSIVAMPGSRLCPVHDYNNMCAKVPANQFGQVFVLPVSNKIVPVSDQQYQIFF